MSERTRNSLSQYRTLRRNIEQKGSNAVSDETRNGPGQDPARPELNAETIDVDAIREALHGMRFGQVTIIVQDGVIIQIDRMERRRLK